MKIMKVNIQFFAEGAGDGGADGADGADNASAAEDGAEPGDNSTESEEDRRSRYESLKKEFKAELDEETGNVIKARVRNLKGENERYRAALERQGIRYGINDGNVDAIIERMSNDDSVYAQRAEAEGLTVDQVKYVAGLEQQALNSSKMLKQQREQAIIQDWNKQAEQVGKKYGVDFDLNAELTNNREFGRLLAAGVPVEAAYKVTHMEEFNARVAKIAHDKTEEAVTNRIKARGTRPPESGSDQSAAQSKIDPAKLTKEQREDIRRRVKRGEKITF